VELLATCPYFQTERLTMPSGGAFFSESEGMTFEIFGVLQGRTRFEWSGAPVTVESVDWVLIPAEMGEYEIVAESDTQLLRVFVP
jgi:mannose-6-phosphate isomerase